MVIKLIYDKYKNDIGFTQCENDTEIINMN